MSLEFDRRFPVGAGGSGDRSEVAVHSVKSSRLLKLAVVAGLVIFSGGLAAGPPAWVHDALPSPDVSAFGDAVSHGSTSDINLRAPVTGMAATPD